MTLIKKFFINLYLFLLLFLITYQDFPAVNYIGAIGRSPILLLVPIFICTELFLFFKHKSFRLTKIQKVFSIYLVYIIFISLVYILILSLTKGYYFLDENIVIKGIKGLTYYLLIFLFIRHMYQVFSLYKTIEKLFFPFFFFTLITYLIMIVEYNNIPNAFPYLHSNLLPYYRIRLLTMESSMTGTIVMVLSCITLFISSRLKSGIRKGLSYTLVTVFVMHYMLVTGSKGFLITIFVVLIIMYLSTINFRKITKTQLLVSLVMPILLLIWFFVFYGKISQSVLNDIHNYTSVSTRASTIVASVLIAFKNPLGVGTGAYIAYFPDNLLQGYNLIQNTLNIFTESIKLNSAELLNYTTSSENLGVKSGVFQWLMIGGLGTIIFFYKIFKVNYDICKRNLLLSFSFLFVTTSIIFYIPIDNKFEVWMFFSFVEFLNKIIQEKDNK
jgi:hypothetical protein